MITFEFKYLPSSMQEIIKKHYHNRHYYIKMALQSIKLKEISDMHKFCFLAEKEQESIEQFAKFYNLK